MIKRKTSFAAPFVLVAASAAAGCGGGHKAEAPHENPPGPERRSPDECAKLQAGAACHQDHDGACSVPNETGCGIIGWDCSDEGGKAAWKAQTIPCEAGQDAAPLAPDHDNPPGPGR